MNREYYENKIIKSLQFTRTTNQIEAYGIHKIVNMGWISCLWCNYFSHKLWKCTAAQALNGIA